MEDREKYWQDRINEVLVGRTIVKARYMTDEEQEYFGWYSKSIVIELDNGDLLFPSRDDEGNDAGALFTTNESAPVLPVC
jgi:hypothetical protein